MGRVVYGELIKLLRSRHIWILTGIFLLIPAILGLGVRTQNASVEVEGTYSFATYAFTILSFLNSLLIIYLGVVVTAAASLAREMEDGSFKMILIRCPNRWSVYAGKFVAVNAVMAAGLLVLVAASVISYFAFVHETTVSQPAEAEHIRYLTVAIFASVGGIAMIASIALLLSLNAGYTGSLMAGIGLLLAMKFLERWESVRNWVPTVLADAANYIGRAQVGPSATHGFAATMAYVVVLLVAGMWWVEKKDITR